MRAIITVAMLLGARAYANATEVLGWTADGASFVYTTSEFNGACDEYEAGNCSNVELGIVVDARTGSLSLYRLSSYQLTELETKRYGALPDKAAYEAWSKQHPVRCVDGRRSPDGKAQADVRLIGKKFVGRWRRSDFVISSKPSDGEDGVSEAYRATLAVTSESATWPTTELRGSIAFYGAGLGSDVTTCWSPDGRGVAWIAQTGKTMRDPETTEFRIATANGNAFDPESTRTESQRAWRANIAGMRSYRAKKYAQAMKRFRDAIASDGSFVPAHYNLACAAALQGDKATAVAELKWLAASSDPLAKAKLDKAKTDPDLSVLAGDGEVNALFKR